jgi:hypothetical protein
MPFLLLPFCHSAILLFCHSDGPALPPFLLLPPFPPFRNSAIPSVIPPFHHSAFHHSAIPLPFCHSAIPLPFRHSAIPPFYYHSAIPPFRHFTIPSFRHSAIPSAIPPFHHSTIPPFHYHSAIPPFRHSITILPFRYSAIPPFRHSAIPPFRHSVRLLLGHMTPKNTFSRSPTSSTLEYLEESSSYFHPSLAILQHNACIALNLTLTTF